MKIWPFFSGRGSGVPLLSYLNTVSLFQGKRIYEKVGEATETALVVLAEKMNVYGTNKSGLSPRDIGNVCNRVIQQKWKKVGDFVFMLSSDLWYLVAVS